MNINATLVVQAGNFFVAYLLFRHILLKPGYDALCQKASYRTSLEDTVAQDEHAVEKEQQRQRDAWAQFRAWCSKYKPAMADRMLFFRGISKSLTVKEIPAAQKNKVRSALTDAIMTQLKERYGR